MLLWPAQFRSVTNTFFLALSFLLSGFAGAVTAPTNTPTPTATATNTPTTTTTPTPSTCNMSATLSTIASPSTVAVGDTVTVTLSINSRGGCRYAGPRDSWVSQLGTAGVFTPASQTKPAGELSYKFTAASVGTINFRGRVDGEYEVLTPTGWYWSQAYLYADSASVTVVTPTPTTTPDPSWTSTPTPTETPTPTITNTPTPSATPTSTVTNTSTPTVTNTPSPTKTPTPTITNTLTPSATPTSTVTNTSTPTVTNTPSPTDTPTPTITNTSTPSATPTSTVTNTSTPTVTSTPSLTGTPTSLATGTPLSTSTPTRKPTPSPSSTPTSTPGVPTFTPTPAPALIDTDGDGVMDEFDKYPTDATKQGKDGVQSKGSLGSSVAYLGDINRDGYGDYVAGSALQDVNGLKDVGVAYVISGKTGAVVRTFTGISANDYFGHAVANAGDFDRDGVNDIIIGAYGTDVDYGNGTLVKDVGSISVFSGSTGALIYRKWGSQAKDYFGYSVAGGIEQPIYTPTPTGILFPTIITPSMWPSPTPGVILGGSPTPTPVCSGGGVIVSGGGFICSISTTTPTPAPAFRSYSSSIVIYDSTYNSLPYIGIAVGSPLADIDDGSGMLLKDAGKVEVFYGGGSTTYSQFSGDAAMGKFGSSVALAGDVNGDGRSDIVAGAPSSNSATGYVKVISLSNNLTLNTLSGGNVGDSFGFSVSAAGDVNNDGFNDVIVGAYKKDSSGKQDVGSAAIYSGNTSQVLYEFTGDVVKDLLGFSVASAGDINNDGFDDVVVSSYGYDVPATNTSATLKDAGKITVYSGANGNTLFSVNGEGKQDIFGSSVSAGDVNKDGVPDILVGAFKDDVQNNGASMKDAGSITIISGAAALP